MPITDEQGRILHMSLAPEANYWMPTEYISPRRRPGVTMTQIIRVPATPGTNTNAPPTQPSQPVNPSEPGVNMPPTTPSLPQYFADKAGQLRSVTVSGKWTGNAVEGVCTTQLQGPAILERITVSTDAAGTGTDAWNCVRVDISRHNALQSFTFQASSIPSGGIPDDLTVFGKGIIKEVTGPQIEYDTSWWRAPYGTSSGTRMLDQELSLQVPWEYFYVKVYAQVDEASVRFYDVQMAWRFFNDADAYEVANDRPVVIWSPPTVVVAPVPQAPVPPVFIPPVYNPPPPPAAPSPVDPNTALSTFWQRDRYGNLYNLTIREAYEKGLMGPQSSF